MVSGGPFWPNQRELSRHLKYIALERIPEFESSHPSQAVRSPPSPAPGRGRASSAAFREVRKAEDYFCDLPDLTIAPDMRKLADEVIE
jgi:hypothetical protein